MEADPRQAFSRGQELAELIAERTLDGAGATHGCWVDIRVLAGTRHISVEYRQLDEAGLLFPMGDDAIVHLNVTEPEPRMRFTLAHELAHWLLRRYPDELTHDASEIFDSEEYLCDKVAGALLMPRELVVHRFGHRARNLDAVHDLARDAQVSLSAALVRLRDVLRWRVSLFQWVEESRRWVIDGEAGLFPNQQGRMRTTEATRYELTRLAGTPTGRSTAGLAAAYDGIDVMLPAEVSVRAHRAVALVRLPYRDLGKRRHTPQPATNGRGSKRPWSYAA